MESTIDYLTKFLLNLNSVINNAPSAVVSVPEGNINPNNMYNEEETNCIELEQTSPIPQVDGCVKSIPDDESFRDKICKFCDEDFNNPKDYSAHMKLHGFMCNNCLDYFSDKPWFSHDDLTFVKYGAIPIPFNWTFVKP